MKSIPTVIASFEKTQSKIILSREEGNHLSKVLRVRENDLVTCHNGQGLVARTKVTKTSHSLELTVDSIIEKPRTHHVTLAFSLSKKNAVEFMIKRGTELGAYSFAPLLTDHSFKSEFNQKKYQRMILECCKQSQQVYFPFIEPIQPLEEWLNELKNKTHIIVCDEDRRNETTHAPSTNHLISSLLIGPEGGWSDNERKLFKKHQLKHLGLGPQRLRTELAALVGLTLIKKQLGEI